MKIISPVNNLKHVDRMDPSSRNIRPNVQQKDISSKKNYLVSALKSFETTINDKKKKYFDKVQSLVIAWDQLAVYVSLPSSESPITEVETLFSHTLRFVLRADWPRAGVATQTHLTVTLQRFITVLSNSKKYPYILQQCRVLESVVKNPWSHPTLSKIFAGEEVEINDLLDYFMYENGRVIVVRLEMMLEAQCEDIALRLSKSCLLTYNNSHPLELDYNQEELDYITDIYFCSLYKGKKKKELTNELKVYELDEGLQLLKRYNKNGGVGKPFNDSCKDARVWKCSDGVIELVSNTLLANAVLHDYLIDSDTILPDLIAEWAAMQKPEDGVDASPISLGIIRKLVLSAGSSKCIYPFCSYLIENCGACKERDLNVPAECLIRAINQNMNEIEYYRVQRDYENLKITYEQLSQGFVLISKLFNDQKNIYRECLLTSFSLRPSRASLQELETFIDKSFNEEHSLSAIASNNQNALESPENAIGSDQKVPSCTETVVADYQNVPCTVEVVDNSNIPQNSEGIDNQDVPCSPKSVDNHNVPPSTNDVDNNDTSDGLKRLDNQDTLPSLERVENHDIPPNPNSVDNHDMAPSPNIVDNHNTSDGSKLIKSDPDVPPSSSDAAENAQSAPSSLENTVKLEVSETVSNAEHSKLEDKPVVEPTSLNSEPETAVPANETAVVELETRVVSATGGLLSLATDTKLKSDGAVEELVKGAAPGYCNEVENLTLDESMKMDLSSILRYQRVRSLSWELEWSELKSNCENFLEIFEARGFEDVELKYLDIDYSQFKDQPINEDDYIGIEKGYEHFVEPEPVSEESDHGRRSSGDTDEDYSFNRRKKIIRRNKLKKVKPKFKPFYGDVSEEFSGAGNVYFIKKKRKLSEDSVEGEFTMRKKRVKIPKIFGETDVAIDSQSENHPPDYHLNEVVDESQSASNLQLLRQYRIGMKTTPSGGELSEIAYNDAKLNRPYQMKPVVIIPKCDDEEEEADKEKLIRPRISVTFPVPGKRSTIQMKPVRFRRSSSTDSLNDFSANLKVEIRRCDGAGRALNNEENEFATTPLDDELRSMMELFDPSHTESADQPATVTVKSEPELLEDCTVKIEPIEEAKIDETVSFPQIRPLVINIAKMRSAGLEKKFKKPRGRPKKSYDESETNPPCVQKPVPCSAAPSQPDSAVNSHSTDSDPQPTQHTPISFNNCAPSVPDGLASNATENTSVSWGQNSALKSTPSVCADFNSISATAITPAYSQTLDANSVHTSCSVHVPLNVTSFDPDGSAPSSNYVESEVKSPIGTDSGTTLSTDTLPISNHTRKEVTVRTISPMHPNSDAALSSDMTHAFSCNQTERVATSNTSEHTPSLFANVNAVASSSTDTVNPQQTTSPNYTNVVAPSSSTGVVSAPDFSQTSTAIENVACSMSEQPSLEISNSRSSNETVQMVLGTYSELAHKFSSNLLDGEKRKLKENVAFPDQLSVPSHLPEGRTPTEMKKRGHKRKNEGEVPDGQYVKIKRQRKPKKDTTMFEYSSFTEGDQSPVEGQPVKIKRARQPKRSEKLDHQSSDSVMTSPASTICSSSTFVIQSPTSAGGSTDPQLSTILAVSDVNYQPTVVLPDVFPSSTMKSKKSRKPKSNAQTDEIKKEIAPSDHQPSEFSATEDYLPTVSVSSSTDANRVLSSVFAAESSIPQPSFSPSVANSNTPAHFVRPITDSNYPPSVVTPIVGQGPAIETVKIKRARKPKNIVALPDNQSLSQSSSAYSDSDPDYHPNSDISFVGQRTAVQKLKMKRPRNPKPATKLSDNQSSTTSDKKQTGKRGRPRKPKAPETSLFDHQSSSVLVSAVSSSNCNQPISYLQQSSVLSVPFANAQSSSADSNSGSPSLILRTALTIPPADKAKRPRKPKKNFSPTTDGQFVIPIEVKAEEGTVIEVDHQLSPVSALEVHPSPPPSYLEVGHQMNSVRDPKSRAALENGVVKPGSLHPEVAVPIISATADARYPMVLIPELKLPSSVNAPTASANNSVRRPSGTPKKKEADSAPVTLISNGHTRYSLPTVEVRVPSIPLSHFQQYEMKHESGAALPRTTFANHCTLQSSTSTTPARTVAVNGVKNAARKPEASASSDEFTSTIITVESTCSEAAVRGSSTAVVNHAKLQRVPKFSVPPKTYLKSYLNGGGSSNYAPAPFINASTPKTLAEGYSVIAVPDLNSLPDLRKSPQVQRSNLDQLADHSQQQEQQQQQQQQQQCAPVYDHRGDGAKGNTVSRQQYAGDSRSSASSQNYSSLPINESTVSVANVKVEYDVDDVDNASPSLCISIPEDAAFPESYLTMRNYLPLIKNANNPIPPREQTVSVSSNNDLADLIRQLLPDQMSTCGPF